jgi:hypothetical protein
MTMHGQSFDRLSSPRGTGRGMEEGSEMETPPAIHGSRRLWKRCKNC